ncbi:hypothetical protein BEN47_02150 [Hymenobacter lapidarius]|uniref:ABC transporter domain-containing protein n=1 Tax=Hymenobacter lapidarius TaxID=1908237 RepID=A0A1G1T2R9_9BACT|nr:ABC transporter ATP-binding protein [Hymenobacter lapidarius]OGX85156.1 hypothetical protein BEN47_02150 [Hymenobacter lapidarius]
MELLSVSGIRLEERGQEVLQSISFTQQAGQKLALAGESGTGKSTLLQVIAGLIQPSVGTVLVQGQRVRGPADTLVPGHPGVAYLTQTSELPHSLRVEQVLRYANKQPAAAAHSLYELCRIDHLLARRTEQLSGGEQQRVALARLLLSTPQLLLLDEPYSNLDRTHKQVLQQVIADVSSRLNITTLLVSHDPADILSWADSILVLRKGHIVQQDIPERIYYQPATEYTAALFGDYSLVRGADRQALKPVSARRADATVLLVRPEQFQLGPAKNGPLRGTVRSVRFFGSYYILEVELPETIVRVRAEKDAYRPGTVVAVSLKSRAGWDMKAPKDIK